MDLARWDMGNGKQLQVRHTREPRNQWATSQGRGGTAQTSLSTEWDENAGWPNPERCFSHMHSRTDRLSNLSIGTRQGGCDACIRSGHEGRLLPCSGTIKLRNHNHNHTRSTGKKGIAARIIKETTVE